VVDDGRIRILGTLKGIIVTSTGQKIAPADLERAALPALITPLSMGAKEPAGT
jgi:long-subunit acyl-CoA synthetase (AMP-forming)